MKYKTYEKYKDSNEEWIGMVPESWIVEPIREFYDYRAEKVSDKVYEPLSVTKQGILPQLEHAAKTDNNDSRKKVKKGDFVINSRSDRKGSCGVSPYEGSVSLIYHVLSSKDSTINRYAHYLFRSMMFAEEFYKWGHGIVDDLWSTRWDEMKKIKIPMPPKEDRIQIGNYLDKRIGNIDEQIYANKKLVELLEEKRITLINQMVIKGLNPESPMKDSGVDWIGEIPEHWNVLTLKKCCEKITDGSHFSPDTTLDGKYYITVRNVVGNSIDFANAAKISIKDYNILKTNGCEPKKGDVLLSKDGTIGKCIVVDDNDFVILSSLGLLRPNNSVLSDYLRYYLISDLNIKQMYSYIRGSALKRLTINIIKELLIVIPPLDEQIKIINYLNPKIEKIEKTITKVQENIGIMEEYKASLIHHVVTGKIDVREEVI